MASQVKIMPGSQGPNLDRGFRRGGGSDHRDESCYDVDLRDDGSWVEDDHNNRGAAYARQGEFDKAVTDFEGAIRINAKDAAAYRNRGMALKKLGVPTEFFVYPGNTHGIPDARNQVVKMMAEFNWFEKWINGKQTWFSWKDLLKTLPDEKKSTTESDK